MNLRAHADRNRLARRLSLGLVAAVLGAGHAAAQSPGPSPKPGLPAADAGVKPAQAFDLPPLPDQPNALLRPPVDPTFPVPVPAPAVAPFQTPRDVPTGYSGPSGITPAEPQTTPDFVPITDRWRIGTPTYDRYGRGHPFFEDYPSEPGNKLDPYNLNVLKGDYPIIGQNTFLEASFNSFTLFEGRRVPTQTGAFESTERPGEFPFFGHSNQFIFSQYTSAAIELFHGDAGFKPKDWAIRIQTVHNVNNLSVSELAVTSPNVLQGQQRTRTFIALQEWFGEVKLADLSPNYDFMSARVGSQFFASDFRGFIFSDINRAVRIFGTRNSNRDQFNLVYFRQLEKDTNSGLNSFHDRRQNVLIANYYRQDFIVPGYTVQTSVHYNNDLGSFKINKNRFLNRPDGAGIFQKHQVDAVYFGLTGDGHWGRVNLTNAFYYVTGRDSLNPLANRSQIISAAMAATELSYDRDWMRFRTSFLWFSGDHNINNGKATGFDSILDNQNFAGGIFSYVQRQTLPLFGVNLTNANSLAQDLRSSKIPGPVELREPRALAVQPRPGHGPDAEAEDDQQHELQVVREHERPPAIPLRGQHPPGDRRRPVERLRVPALPERQRHRDRRRPDPAPRPRLPRPLQQRPSTRRHPLRPLRGPDPQLLIRRAEASGKDWVRSARGYWVRSARGYWVRSVWQDRASRGRAALGSPDASAS